MYRFRYILQPIGALSVVKDRNEMMEMLQRIETKLDVLLMQQGLDRDDVKRASGVDVAETRDVHEDYVSPMAVLGRFTTKQHAALQMVLHGASNAEIARRFNVTENTAKVYVRTIAQKLGVRTRAMIVAKVWSAFEKVDPQDYAAMAGGLPKDWHETYEEPDMYAHLYRHEESV